MIIFKSKKVIPYQQLENETTSTYVSNSQSTESIKGYHHLEQKEKHSELKEIYSEVRSVVKQALKDFGICRQNLTYQEEKERFQNKYMKTYVETYRSTVSK